MAYFGIITLLLATSTLIFFARVEQWGDADANKGVVPEIGDQLIEDPTQYIEDPTPLIDEFMGGDSHGLLEFPYSSDIPRGTGIC